MRGPIKSFAYTVDMIFFCFVRNSFWYRSDLGPGWGLGYFKWSEYVKRAGS